MKNNCNQIRWYIILSLCGLYFLCSCTDSPWGNKDVSIERAKRNKNKNEELTVSAAQQWYQANYAPIVTTRSSAEDSTNRMIKPYWEKAKESNRRRYEVVEIPIRTKGYHLVLDAETAQKWKPGTRSNFIRNTAKIVIERDKKTGRTRSFVMIFVGSYNYLQKTHTMGKNSYLYRQPDFDGSVLFYELNDLFKNGWKYENGKIVAAISPKQKMNTSNGGSIQTRALVEDCTDSCYTYEDEECYEETWADGDDEYGFSFGTTVSCFPIFYEECTTHCTVEDDGNDDDDNWEDNSPSGGSNTGQSDNDKTDETDADKKELEQLLKEITLILKELGIDITKYNVRVNIEMCVSTARTLLDGTIEVCRKFFEYRKNDQASIIWHEVYHCVNKHNSTSSEYTVLDSKNYIHLTPDQATRDYIDIYYNWSCQGLSNEFIRNIINEDLTQTYIRSAEWYENEIQTYKAELNNGIEKSAEYYAELQFLLWKFEQLHNYVKNKK